MNRDEEREEQTRPDIQIPVDLPTALDATSHYPHSTSEENADSGGLPGTDARQETTGSNRIPTGAESHLRESLLDLAERLEELERMSPEQERRLSDVEKTARSLEAHWRLREVLDEEQSSRLELVEARLHGGAHRDSSEFRTQSSVETDAAIAEPLREQEARLRALENAARNRDDRLEALEGVASNEEEAKAPDVAGETAKRLEVVGRQLSRLESDSSERFGSLEAWRLEAEMALEGVFPPESADLVFSQVNELRARVTSLAKQVAEEGSPPATIGPSSSVPVGGATTGGRPPELDQRLESIETKLVELDRRQRDAQVHVGRLQQRLEAQLLDLTSHVEALVTSAAARAHQPDQGLRSIRGIGPKFERLLERAGVSSVGDVAQWTDADIDRVSSAIGVSATRIRREGWVEHARSLADADNA